MQVFQLERQVVREVLARFEPIVAQKTLGRRVARSATLARRPKSNRWRSYDVWLSVDRICYHGGNAGDDRRPTINQYGGDGGDGATMGTTATAAPTGPTHIAWILPRPSPPHRSPRPTPA